jgi:hypothetical protein
MKTKSRQNDQITVEEVLITPEMAVAMLEANKHNRPLSDLHVHRLARQIMEGKWIFNGDAIKFSMSGDVLDGQHRLWAIIYAKIAVLSLVVRGIDDKAFATIDTLRKHRTAADMLYLRGMQKYRTVAAGALQWLVRYQRGIMEEWKAHENRIENSDVEKAYAETPQIVHAAELASRLRLIYNPGVLAFLYHVVGQQSEATATRMMTTLNNATGAAQDDPFFLLRLYMVDRNKMPRDPLEAIALGFKSANAVHRHRKLQALLWRRQGVVPEPFPLLDLKGGQ